MCFDETITYYCAIRAEPNKTVEVEEEEEEKWAKKSVYSKNNNSKR